MRLIRGPFLDERRLKDWVMAIQKYYKCLNTSKLDQNTVISLVCYTDAELQKIQEYDNERQGNDEKIILGTPKFHHKNYTNLALTNPINLEKSGLITELEIALLEHQYYLLKSPTFRLMTNCVKHLKITTVGSFHVKLSDADYITRLIKRYKDTIDQLDLCFKTVKINALKKIYEKLEYWIINIPTINNISLTASNINDKPYKNLLDYNYMQERHQCIIKYKRVLEPFKEAIDNQQKEDIYANIINIIKDDPKFNKHFSKYKTSKVKKVIWYDNTYSTTLNSMSKLCYKAKKKYLPYDVKAEDIGGIEVIIEIDNALENNNRATYLQDNVINQAEVVNDVYLTTSGTTGNCCFCNIM